MKPHLLKLPEVSELIGYPEATLRHWRQTGQGPPSARIGRSVVYRLEDIERWIDDQFAIAAEPRA